MGIVELDGMHTYISSKKTIAGSGLLLIAMKKKFSTAKWVLETQQTESDEKPFQDKT
ncbi:MAG: hypothetical protein KAH20_10170 [Methylococcales bacterium]|nr:hypothetical protein [Methylococcales bacterium]